MGGMTPERVLEVSRAHKKNAPPSSFYALLEVLMLQELLNFFLD